MFHIPSISNILRSPLQVKLYPYNSHITPSGKVYRDFYLSQLSWPSSLSIEIWKPPWHHNTCIFACLKKTASHRQCQVLQPAWVVARITWIMVTLAFEFLGVQIKWNESWRKKFFGGPVWTGCPKGALFSRESLSMSLLSYILEFIMGGIWPVSEMTFGVFLMVSQSHKNYQKK
jgi:hypothetical protein